MAIIPRDLYPLKFKPVIPAWPQGEPQRIAAAGDGSGSPWEVEIVKDIMGLQQSLLLKAGITPTGTPETALESQYYDCLTTLFARSADTTADLIAGSFPNVAGVQTTGFAALNDGGGAFWESTSGTGPASSTDYPNGKVYDSDGREFSIVIGPLNPRAYGAVGDGVTDDVIPIQAAVDTQASRLGAPVYLSAGTYLCSAQITGADRVEFYGDGVGATTLSFAGAGGSFPNSACVYFAGDIDSLPALSNPIAPDDTTITFVSAHGLQANDLILAIDARTSSYAAGDSRFKAGEYFVISDTPTTTTVELNTPAFATTSTAVTGSEDTYATANTAMRVVTPARFILRDMSIIGVADDDPKPVVSMFHCRSSVLERLNITGSGQALIQANHCFDISMTDVEMHNSSLTGTDNNGINLGHCQRVFITRVRGGGSNGMLLCGALDFTDATVNRQIYVNDCYAPQRGDGVGAIRFSGNCEYVTVADTTVAGLRLGGNHARISNCDIEGQPADSATGIGIGWAIYLLNMTGFDVRIDGCMIRARVDITPALIFWSEGFFTLFREGTFVMNDTTIDMAGYAGVPVSIEVRSPSVTPSLRFENVVVIGSNDIASPCLFANSTNAGWKRLDFHRCRFYEVGVVHKGAQLIRHVGTLVERAPGDGLQFPNPAANPFGVRSMHFEGCRVSLSHNAGIFIADNEARVQCSDTVSLSNNVNAAKTTERSSFVFEPASGSGSTSLHLFGNVFGNDPTASNQTFAYHYVDVDTVIDTNTVILGGVPVTRTATIADTLANVQDQNTDDTSYSGTLGLVRGDPSGAPSGAQDLVIGTGAGNRGVYLKSSSTGFSALIFGDTVDADRFIIEMDHTNDHFTFTAAGVAACRIDGGGINPVTADTNSVGDTSRRWAGMYAGAHHFKRMFADGGTVVVAATHLTKSSGWGTGSTFDALTAGRDSAVRVVILTAGGDQSGTPSFTYEFPDGAEGSKIPIVLVTNRGALFAQWSVISTTSTTVTVEIQLTPANAVTYGCNLTLTWPTD